MALRTIRAQAQLLHMRMSRLSGHNLKVRNDARIRLLGLYQWVLLFSVLSCLSSYKFEALSLKTMS